MPEKDYSLEAMRGVAALVVVACHLSIAFYPGIFFGGADAFWYVAVNGNAAVAFFFVLSGFVLTRRAMREEDLGSLARGAIKRWPRLAGPVIAVVILVWLLWTNDLFLHEKAGALANSPWVTSFGDAFQPPDFSPSFLDALYHGGVEVFQGHDVRHYNSALWTMHLELIGSLLASAAAAIVILARRSGLQLVALAIILVAANLFYPGANSLYVAMLLGVALAFALTRFPFTLPLPVSLLLFVFGLYLAGFVDGRSDHAWLAGLGLSMDSAPLANIAAALIVIIAVETTPRMKERMQGRAAVVLGQISFPVYLLHMPVLFSAGALAYIAASSLPSPWPELMATVVTFSATILLALPFALFDRHWTAGVNRAVRTLPLRPGSNRLSRRASVATQRSEQA
jgi:peptidoglycan/LPS O-acetylase OafA/YrhL